MAKRGRRKGKRGNANPNSRDTNVDVTTDYALYSDGAQENFIAGIRPVQGLAMDKIKNFNRNYKILWALLVFFVLFTLILGVGTYLNAFNASRDRAAAETPTYKVRHDSLGSQIVTNYLMGLPPPNVTLGSEVVWPQGSGSGSVTDTETDPQKLQQVGTPSTQDDIPVISGVTLDHGERKDFPLDHNAKLPDPEPFLKGTQEEVLRYYLIMNGQPMMMSINLLVPPKEDITTPPILLNTPSFVEMPKQIEGGVNVKSAPSGMEDMSKYSGDTDGLQDALGRFAKAWAKNDQDTLLSITQDAQGRKYVGLGGWESSGDVNIDWIYQRIPDMTTNESAYVQATFTIKQEVIPETTTGEDDGLEPKEFSMTQTMDFLVHDVGGGLPAIVAWGPAGSWQNLTPYGNARDKEGSAPQADTETEDGSGSQTNAPQRSTSTSGSSRGGSTGGSDSLGDREDAYDAPAIDTGSGSGGSSTSTSTSDDLGIDPDLCEELGVC